MTGPRLGFMLLNCPDCGRVFDLMNPQEAEDWGFGHDCEEEG